MKIVYLTVLLYVLSGCIKVQKNTSKSPDDADTSSTITSKLLLGEKIFSDTNLSLDRTMSCATCHNQDHGYIDDRENSLDSSVSIGQNGTSVGDRNSPTITYAKFIPTFTQIDGEYIGGLFADGRAVNHLEQAKGPFLNAIEMEMPSKESVINRIKENSEYMDAFKSIYGDEILNDAEKAYDAVAEVITEFEKSDSISPFDSQFDQGNLTAQELRGQSLFKSSNCIFCHVDSAPQPLFTNYKYQNIGIPINAEVRAQNGVIIDQGLLDNPNVTDINQKGKFRISSLRNVAVTSPYMHNGIFKELKTVVHFYNTRDVAGAINPETGEEWGSPENSENIIVATDGANGIGNLGLSDEEEDDIVAFLKTLTDSQFEHLN